MKAGTFYTGNGQCVFTVWAPTAEKVTLHIVAPKKKAIQMQKGEEGYFQVELNDFHPGTKYFYQVNDEKNLPDPASHYQPDGVHGPSQVIDHSAYQWQNVEWKGVEGHDMILYELHIGTFTKEGTFKAAVNQLDDLAEIGVNAIEIMPVSQFPGHRNWGYDGVHPYAVQNTYGTPDDFKQFVDACHARGIAVILDVVYNHIGPEGNYFSKFGPYFNSKYSTPWGAAINFDADYADGVRDFFAENALFWFENYHIDGLRLDAIHMVFDMSAIHFWEYVNEKVKKFSVQNGKRIYMIAESDMNSPKVIRSPEVGGYGFDLQWLDDFHHALYVLLDPKGQQYFADFGAIEQLEKAIKDGFVHSGEYVEFRRRKYGRSSAGVPGDKFITFIQNHDQIGNRVLGERLSVLISFDALKMAAAMVLLSPYIPMLFMGEEYAEDNPFLYFVSHSDKDLIEAVQKGRSEDFAKFQFEGDPPDPQAEKTFNASKLNWQKRKKGKHNVMLNWYKELIQLRRKHSALQNYNKDCIQVRITDGGILEVERWNEHSRVVGLFNISEKKAKYKVHKDKVLPVKILDSTEVKWQEKGGKEQKNKALPDALEAESSVDLPPWCVVLYEKV
jgi:maltooligosyltrehalose trehalohydrolase